MKSFLSAVSQAEEEASQKSIFFNPHLPPLPSNFSHFHQHKLFSLFHCRGRGRKVREREKAMKEEEITRKSFLFGTAAPFLMVSMFLMISHQGDHVNSALIIGAFLH
jgi:hypothetical protein